MNHTWSIPGKGSSEGQKRWRNGVPWSGRNPSWPGRTRVSGTCSAPLGWPAIDNNRKGGRVSHLAVVFKLHTHTRKSAAILNKQHKDFFFKADWNKKKRIAKLLCTRFHASRTSILSFKGEKKLGKLRPAGIPKTQCPCENNNFLKGRSLIDNYQIQGTDSAVRMGNKGDMLGRALFNHLFPHC